MAKKSGQFKFRRGDSVGSVDAENDKYLGTCFVDVGDITRLLDCGNPQCIVVGRTGSGKSALLLEVKKRVPDQTETILPESLSLNYIANSDVVAVLTELGVNLDPFFRLLWRHVLALHIFQHIHPATESEKTGGLFSWIARWLPVDEKDEQRALSHQRIVEYLDKHGGQQFWGDVGHRVKQIVCTFENELENHAELGSKASVGTSIAAIKANAGTTSRDSEREKSRAVSEVMIEARQRFQNIVNEIQVRELNGVIDLVRDVLAGADQTIYVVVDKLDLQWADESIRFRLIRALIDTAISFTAARRAKIILAMRIDLIERVYRDARKEPGTQFEKVRDHCLFLNWDRERLCRKPIFAEGS